MKKNLEPLKDALEELADFARKMEPTEYAYFYRLMERMENNVEICILVRDDRLEKLEAILRRDWNLVSGCMVICGKWIYRMRKRGIDFYSC